MIFGLEIGLLIAGIVALVTGRFKLSRDRVTVGTRARVAGLVCLLPLPLSFVVGFLIGFSEAMQNRRFDAREWEGALTLIEGAVAVGCFLVAILVAHFGDSAQVKQRPEDLVYVQWRGSVTEVPLPITHSPAPPQEGIELPPARSLPVPAPHFPSTPSGDARPLQPGNLRQRQVPGWVLAVILLVVLASGGIGLFVLTKYLSPEGSTVRSLGSPSKEAQPKERGVSGQEPKIGQRMPDPLQEPEARQHLPNVEIAPKPPQPVPGALKALAMPTELCSVAFSADSRSVILSDVNGRVSMWDHETGVERCQWRDDACFAQLVFSPNKRWLATATSASDTVTLRDAETAVPLKRMLAPAGGSTVSSVAFSSDSRSLVVVIGGVVYLWDIEADTRRTVQLEADPQLRSPSIFAAEFAPDDRYLLTIGNGRDGPRVRRSECLWDVKTGKLVLSIPAFETEPVSAKLVISPDGRRAALASLEKNARDPNNSSQRPPNTNVLLYDLAERHKLPSLDCQALPTSLAFAPDGTTLAIGHADGSVGFWDTITCRQRSRFTAIRKGNNSAAAPAQTVNDLPEAVRGIWFTPDGKVLATSLRKGVQLWSTLQLLGEQIRVAERLPPIVNPRPAVNPPSPKLETRTFGRTPTRAGCFAVSPDGRWLVTGHGTWAIINKVEKKSDCVVRIWSMETGEEVRRIEQDPPAVSQHLAISPDGKRLLVYEMENATKFRLQLRDLESGKSIRTLEAPDRVTGIAIVPDGRRAIATGWDSALRVWDLETGKEVFRCEEKPRTLLDKLVVSPDGRRVASRGVDNIVRVWDLETFQVVHRLPRITDHLGVGFLADGKRLVTGGRYGIFIRDLDGEEAVHPLDRFGDMIDMAASPDGHHVLASYNNRDSRIWDVEQLREICTIPKSGFRRKVGFSPDGRWAIVADESSVNLTRLPDVP
jgi:WD40 repeat protein